MEQRRRVGIATGQYQGNGQGEDNLGYYEADNDMFPEESGNEDETAVNSATHPLLFFFDIETTGFVVYDDTITDIAAKVIEIPPNYVSQVSFTSLVMTNRHIPEKGINKRQQ